MVRRKTDLSLTRLARRFPRRGRLDPVIHRVPDDVHERILQPLDHRFVQLGFAAFLGQLNFFAQIAGEIAHHPAETIERCPDAKHTDAHRIVARLSGEPLHFFRDKVDLRIAGRARHLSQSCLDSDQLTHNVRQTIQLLRR